MATKPPLLKGFTLRRMVRAREMNGWSQSDLAQQLGVHQATVAQWERGRSLPDTATQIWLMATLFGDAKGRLWELPERLDRIEKRLAKLEKKA